MKAAEVLDYVRGIISARSKTHGLDSVAQLAHAQNLKRAIGHRGNDLLTMTEKESIDMIAVKLSRLANGEPIEDHWDDIIGYAAIAREARGMIPPTPAAEESSD